MASSLALVLSPTVPYKCYFLRNQSSLSPFIRPSSSLHVSFRSLICRCSTDREEDRWLREEQRWLREEQRWLREEQHWARERDSLLREISDLKLQIQSLERRILASDVSSSSSSSVSDAVANVTALLQLLKDKNSNLIAQSGSSSRDMVLEEKRDVEEETVKEVIVQDTASISDRKVERRVENRSALRTGSEGEEFHEMQEVANGAPVASVAETSEFQQTIVGDGDTEIDVSHQRVFLLGENRWEEPSRLRATKGVDKGKTKDVTTKCLQCRGEGRLLCTECDGTGEPNIEPQFLEWVDEDAKCPYCEGLGYTICDICAGKTVI